jgi:clan AA aspartic protease
MGIVYEEITLKNVRDLGSVKNGHMDAKDARETTVNALVDTGAGTLVINDTLRKELGLDIEGLKRSTFGNDERIICKVTEPVEIQWKERSSVCRALVTSDNGDVLLGAIPLEDMDLIVNPGKQELVGAHGDDVVCLVM